MLMKAASVLVVGGFEAKREAGNKQCSHADFVPYLLIDRSEEVNLICQTLQLSLQLNLIHVGLIDILEERKEKQNFC